MRASLGCKGNLSSPVPFCLQVFRELEDYDVSDAFGVSREDGPFWWAGLTARRRRRSSVFPWPWGITKDSGFAFTVRRDALRSLCPLLSSSCRDRKGLRDPEMAQSRSFQTLLTAEYFVCLF